MAFGNMLGRFADILGRRVQSLGYVLGGLGGGLVDTFGTWMAIFWTMMWVGLKHYWNACLMQQTYTKSIQQPVMTYVFKFKCSRSNYNLFEHNVPHIITWMEDSGRGNSTLGANLCIESVFEVETAKCFTKTRSFLHPPGPRETSNQWYIFRI